MRMWTADFISSLHWQHLLMKLHPFFISSQAASHVRKKKKHLRRHSRVQISLVAGKGKGSLETRDEQYELIENEPFLSIFYTNLTSTWLDTYKGFKSCNQGLKCQEILNIGDAQSENLHWKLDCRKNWKKSTNIADILGQPIKLVMFPLAYAVSWKISDFWGKIMEISHFFSWSNNPSLLTCLVKP